jgi:hypothetical protein
MGASCCYILCSYLPFCYPSFWDRVHKCSKCGAEIGIFKPYDPKESERKQPKVGQSVDKPQEQISGAHEAH